MKGAAWQHLKGVSFSGAVRPNPSLKRSANGSPPGPVSGAGAFSTARAWRATVVSRLAHTLGLTKTKSCAMSIKTAPPA